MPVNKNSIWYRIRAQVNGSKKKVRDYMKSKDKGNLTKSWSGLTLNLKIRGNFPS